MYEKIEKIVVRTLSPFEYEKLEELKKEYDEQQIIDAYKNSSVKNVNYITKKLQNTIRKVPKWFNSEIKSQELDAETEKEFDEFNKFIKEFRDDTNNNI